MGELLGKWKSGVQNAVSQTPYHRDGCNKRSLKLIFHIHLRRIQSAERKSTVTGRRLPSGGPHGKLSRRRSKQLASLQLREMFDLGKHTYANRLGDDDSEWAAADELEWMPPSSLPY